MFWKVAETIALHPMFVEGWCGERARDGRGLLLPWGGRFSVGEAATEPPDSPTAADLGFREVASAGDAP